MRIIFISLVLISFFQLNCKKEKIKPISFVEICNTAIDSTLSFDSALNDGDTLFLEFPKTSDLSERTKKTVIGYIQEKHRFKVILSSLDNLTINDATWSETGNLKNFFISIRSIESEGQKKIIIESQKYKGMLAAVNIETVFEYLSGNWVCTSSRITSMS